MHLLICMNITNLFNSCKLDLIKNIFQSSGKKLSALTTQRRPSLEKPRAGSLKSDTNLEAAPHELRELLSESHLWDFDIFKLERLTEKR